jgi:putative transposase
MNAIMERWVQTCRHELLDRTLIWNQRHLLQALREFEHFYNEHRPHRTLWAAAPLRPLPEPMTDPEQIARLDVRRRDRLGGILHEYQPCGGDCGTAAESSGTIDRSASRNRSIGGPPPQD